VMASASGCDTTCKTKRSALTLEKKLEIIAELRKGKSQRLDRFSLVSLSLLLGMSGKLGIRSRPMCLLVGILRLQRSVAS